MNIGRRRRRAIVNPYKVDSPDSHPPILSNIRPRQSTSSSSPNQDYISGLADSARKGGSSTKSSSAVALSESEALAIPELTRFPGLQSPEDLEKRVSDFISKLESYQSSWEAAERR